MISSSHLSRLIIFLIILISFTSSNRTFAEEEAADIWKKEISTEENKTDSEKDITIESPILSGDVEKIVIKIDEGEILSQEESVIGIFDPEENNFNLEMWKNTDGENIKKILKRINTLNLSKTSEDLLFQILFTNAYPPKKNLSSEEFLKIKINWLINKKRINDLETLIKNNPETGSNSRAIKFLVNEYLSSADINSACEKIDFIDSNLQNNYLEKFKIYCLIKNDKKDEAQLIYDLLLEKGFSDKFFEDKIF